MRVVEERWQAKDFIDKDSLEIAKILSAKGVEDFAETHLNIGPSFGFGALVAFPGKDGPTLCELSGPMSFQPEIKKADEHWYASIGSGQVITDPFLALLRSVFWKSGAPDTRGGIFTAMWALMHAVEVNPGGINDPIHIAVLSSDKGQLTARRLDDEELAEHRNIVESARDHLAQFKEIVSGKMPIKDVPTR